MRKPLHPHLRQTINRKAQELSLQSFSRHRNELEQKVRALLKDGMPVEQVQMLVEEGLLPECQE